MKFHSNLKLVTFRAPKKLLDTLDDVIAKTKKELKESLTRSWFYREGAKRLAHEQLKLLRNLDKTRTKIQKRSPERVKMEY